MKRTLLIAAFGIQVLEVLCQINFGTLSLNQNPRGELEIGLNQAANIFGFGADRGLQLTTGKGKFDIQSNQGALIGGERLGVDSGLGLKEGQGLNLGSTLNFGTNPPGQIAQPGGQLQSFIENIGKFFQSFGQQPTPMISSTGSSRLPASVGRAESSVPFRSLENSQHKTVEYHEPLKPNYHATTEDFRGDNSAIETLHKVDGDTREHRQLSSLFVSPPSLPGLVEIDAKPEDKPRLNEMLRHFYR